MRKSEKLRLKQVVLWKNTCQILDTVIKPEMIKKIPKFILPISYDEAIRYLIDCYLYAITTLKSKVVGYLTPVARTYPWAATKQTITSNIDGPVSGATDNRLSSVTILRLKNGEEVQ